MTSGHGYIRDFSKPAPGQDVKILQGRQQGVDMSRLHEKSQPEQTKIELRKHEEIIVEEDKLRHRKREPSEPEIRIRSGVDKGEWERIRRLEDEDDGQA